MAQGSPTTARIEAAIAPVLASAGFELVLAEMSARQGVLRLYIDRHVAEQAAAQADAQAQQARVTVEDCTRVSRLVSDLLDGEGLMDGAPNYRLEVSSPGLDRPLTKPEHFRRFAGQKVRFKTRRPVGAAAINRMVGLVQSADDAGVVLLLDDGQQLSVAYEAIERARLEPSFSNIKE